MRFLQVMPVAVEVIRWYDVTILTELLDDHLSPATSILNYGLAMSVYSCVNHVTKLIPILNCPPPTWQVSVQSTVRETECVQTTVQITASDFFYGFFLLRAPCQPDWCGRPECRLCDP